MQAKVQRALAALTLGVLLVPQFAFAAPQSETAKKSSTRTTTTRTRKASAPAATSEDLRQIREMLQQQQQQIEALRQQMAERDRQLQQAQQQLQAAQSAADEAKQQASQATSAANTQQSAIEQTNADLASVKSTISESAVSTQDDQKRMGALEATVNRFRWSGDVRVRYENFFRDQLADRHRQRIRVRFGLESKINEDFTAGAFLATGAFNDPTSTNETLTSGFARKAIELDRGYITYAPQAHKWLSVTGGKFAATWQKTNQIFDPDLNPEGFSEKLSWNVTNPFVKNLTLIGMQLSMNEVGGGNDAFIFGGQIQSKLQLADFWTMTPSYTIMNFRNPSQLVNNTFVAGTSLTTASVGGTTLVTGVANTGVPTATGFLSGSAYFAPNGVTNCVVLPTAPATTPRPRLCSDYLISDVILNNQFKTPMAKLPFNLMLEFEKNLNAVASPVDGNLHDTMYFIEGSFGQSKAKGDALFGYSFGRTDQDAVLASFAESDQRWPTNVIQHRIFGNYRLKNNVVLGYTQWIGRTLNTRLPIAANGGAIALPAGYAGTGRTEPWLKRGQLDLVFTF